MEWHNRTANWGTFLSLFSYPSASEKTTAGREWERVQIQAGPVVLEGELVLSESGHGLIIFVNNSQGSQYAASRMRATGLSTLQFDLLTQEEKEMGYHTRRLRADISLLARRTIGALDWIRQQPFAADLKLGLFSAGTAAAAALIAAAERPEQIHAVVGQCDKMDLVVSTLPRVKAPVLLIMAQMDSPAPEVGQQVHPHEIHLIPGSARFLEEKGAADTVCRIAVDWFDRNLVDAASHAARIN